ncbi:hypothetical protein LX32DRAFT_164137 [Colletotrichum zoysiae]|uniref:Uncharacterized protein n=1 Tax=Colletotrichum zoysiae TaxID=1216348 RepID=A0AAD9H7R2_9PEZI|nr:hypothetical protein LX32DRAFT_164137 [Colletotrichum zoysiae]
MGPCTSAASPSPVRRLPRPGTLTLTRLSSLSSSAYLVCRQALGQRVCLVHRKCISQGAFWPQCGDRQNLCLAWANVLKLPLQPLAQGWTTA